MTPKRSKYIREERNGKVVYVPSSDRDAISPQSLHRPHTLGVFKRGTQRALRTVGGALNVWFPPFALIGASSITVGLSWVAWQAITNPDVIFWINQFTPGNLNRKIPADDQPKTIDEVLAQLKRYDKNPGIPISLSTGFSFQTGLEGATSVAIPILGEQQDVNCPEGCPFIQSIQIYRTLDLPAIIQVLQRKRRFRRVNRLQLFGPSDEDLNRLIRSVKRSGSGEGSSLPLGMTQIEPKTIESEPDLWLILSGLRSKGNASASYGQILHFSQARSQLSVMLNWLSPSGQLPEWKDITGDGRPEIIIDQSIELEPSFAAYEIKRSPNGSQWVTPFDLNKPAINNSTYQGALQLAKSGLWKQSHQQLKMLKEQLGKNWTATAQAQLQFIQLHANALNSTSNLAFADPIEELQTLLIQGSWEQAQRKLFESKDTIAAMQRILASDNGQIGDRIQVSAQVSSNPESAIDWGIFYHYSKGGKAQATTWITKEHPSYAARVVPYIKKLANPPISKVLPTPNRSDNNSKDPTNKPLPKKSEEPQS